MFGCLRVSDMMCGTGVLFVTAMFFSLWELTTDITTSFIYFQWIRIPNLIFKYTIYRECAEGLLTTT